MSSTPQQQPSARDELLVKLDRRTKWLLFIVLTLILLFVVSVISGLLLSRWKLMAIEKAQRDLEFGQFVSDYNNGQDFVQPDVNIIQFLRHGYSITFDKVEYTQNGLALSGQIGNPTHLWISSLALNFSARPYPYKIRDKWDRARAQEPNFFPWWNAEWSIGTAQTTVGLLNPGLTASFTVTIPNVKQTSDSMEIAVWFSGERYQYSGK